MSDRVAIVTGGASGIGRAVAERLLADGWIVAPFDIQQDALTSVWDGVDRALPQRCDVSDRASVEAAVAAVESATPAPIGALVNSAGIYRPAQVLDITDEDFDALIAINLRGTFLPGQVVARAMARTGGGSIVNVTSVAASEPTAENGAYAATKGGVTSLTRAFAVSLAPHNIRVNAVQPGPVATPMGAAATVDPVYEERMLRRVLRGRYAQPADIAGAVAYLVSDDADYVTGVVLPVDGGVLAHR